MAGANKKVRDLECIWSAHGRDGRRGCFCQRPDVRLSYGHSSALQIHHTAPGTTHAAGVYIMIVEDRVYLFTDATVNIEPSAEDLAETACLAADFAKRLELDPRVAFLSFSNFGSTPHPLSDKVRKAVELVKTRRPDLAVDGEMQADTAVRRRHRGRTLSVSAK